VLNVVDILCSPARQVAVTDVVRDLQAKRLGESRPTLSVATYSPTQWQDIVKLPPTSRPYKEREIGSRYSFPKVLPYQGHLTFDPHPSMHSVAGACISAVGGISDSVRRWRSGRHYGMDTWPIPGCDEARRVEWTTQAQTDPRDAQQAMQSHWRRCIHKAPGARMAHSRLAFCSSMMPLLSVMMGDCVCSDSDYRTVPRAFFFF